MKKTIITILFCILSIVNAQSFGQNKVQYRDFDWSYIQTPNFDIYLGAINQYGTPFYQSTSNRKFGFFSVGDGLTSGQCVNLYSAVKQLQVDLNRNLTVF